MGKVERYIPTIGKCDWNIKEASVGKRKELKERLVFGLVTNEEDYKTVIGYMYKKFPFEMDGVKAPDTGNKDTAIQWNYSTARNKLMVYNNKINENHDMYALIIYDKERDYEPICFSGSYFKLGKATNTTEENEKYLLNSNGNKNLNGNYQAYGNGYVLFVDPNYRRLGIGSDTWWAEARLYTEALNIRFQKEIQNEFSLKSTQRMFSSPDKCIITSPGRLKNDGTRCQIRCLLDYNDNYLEECFDEMMPNLKNSLYDKPHWNFLEREKFTKQELLSLWK